MHYSTEIVKSHWFEDTNVQVMAMFEIINILKDDYSTCKIIKND